MSPSQPPMPAKLREMLSDYPEYLDQIQRLLAEVATEPATSPRFELANWALEGQASKLLSDARTELKAAELSGDAGHIARANEKMMLMGGVVLQKPWLGDKEFSEFFRR